MEPLTRKQLKGLLAEFGITVDKARDMLMQPDNLHTLYTFYMANGDENNPMTAEEAATAVNEMSQIATHLDDLSNGSDGDDLRMLFYEALSDLTTQLGMRGQAPSTSPMASPAPPHGPLSPMVNPPIGTLTTTADQVPGQPTTNSTSTNTSMTIPTSEQDLERYVQLSMKYGPQRAKDIIKTYGYSPQTTDTTVDRGRHDYTPMTIARYTDFQPEARDLFQRGLNRWGYPIGPRLLGKQYIDGIR